METVTISLERFRKLEECQKIMNGMLSDDKFVFIRKYGGDAYVCPNTQENIKLAEQINCLEGQIKHLSNKNEKLYHEKIAFMNELDKYKVEELESTKNTYKDSWLKRILK